MTSKESDDYLKNPYDYDPIASGEVIGGANQNCKRKLKKLSQSNDEQLEPHKDVGDMVNLAYELKKNFECNPIVVNPEKYESLPELFNAVVDHARRWQRLENSTIEHRMRYARRMSKHPIFPIDFFDLNYDQFIAYMQCREDYGKAGHFALKHDLQTIHTFLNAYGIDPRGWYYRLPSNPAHKERLLPLPETVYDLINYKFSKDPYENALYQYLHAHNFWIGWRVPSEPCIMTVDNIDFDTCSIIITEQKKHHSTRQIFPEPAIITGQTRKSLKNWLKWRDKVETSQSGNALYLQPSGKPFKVRHLGHKLSVTGRKVYPNYRPYDSRHWCAIGRLIKTKIETGRYDCYTVKNWLGHETIATTENYIQHAENYYRRAPYDWIKHTLKFNILNMNNIAGESVEKSKQRLKTYVSNGNSPREENGPEEI